MAKKEKSSKRKQKKNINAESLIDELSNQGKGGASRAGDTTDDLAEIRGVGDTHGGGAGGVSGEGPGFLSRDVSDEIAEDTDLGRQFKKELGLPLKKKKREKIEVKKTK